MSEPSSLTVIDWFAAIVRRIWLVTGIAALFVAIWWAMQSSGPQAYVSTSLLALSAEQGAEAESILRSPVVLDAVAEKFTALQKASPEATRRSLNAAIELSTTAAQRKSKTTLIQLDVVDREPVRAQNIANMLIDSWLELTKPKPMARARIELEIGQLEQQLKETTGLQEKLQSEATSLVVPNSLQGELAGSLVRLLTEREELVRRLAERRAALNGINREIVISPPTLPVENIRRRDFAKGLVLSGLIGVVFGSLLALILEWFRRNRRATVVLADAVNHSRGKSPKR